MEKMEQHFLVVDDLSTIRRMVMGILKELEYTRMVDADDGSSAWKILEAGQVPVSFVITDWNMPTMDGLALLRKIREEPRLAKLPVLMITSEARKESVVSAAEAGADGYIIKPFNAATLNDKIQKIVARRALMAA